jgi:membrane protease YdiL (CAAX protease family)
MRLRGCLNRGRHSKALWLRLFVGWDGVWAGWRAALFILVMAVQLLLIAIVLHEVFRALVPHGLRGGLTPVMVGVDELGLLLSACGASALMAFLEDTRLTAYGLTDPRKLPRLGAGFFAGLAALGALMLALRVGGFATELTGGLSLAGDIGYALTWLCVSLLIGLAEEFVLRGYLLSVLRRGLGFWGAACLTSLLFGALHGMNPGETPLGLIDTVGAGLLFCLFIRCTGSLWFAIGFHGAWDYAENFLFGTADSGMHCVGTLLIFVPRGNVYLSGGITGPEGSLFCTGILLFAALLARKFMHPATFLALPRVS